MDVEKIELGDGTVLNLRDKRADGCVHVYRDVAGTAAVTTSPRWSALYDVTDPEITEYYDGMLVSILVPVAGNGSYGTALQINSLGYKPIVFGVSSMISTRYPVGGVILAQYNAAQTAKIYLGGGHQNETVTGCWQVMDYDSDSTVISRLKLERGSTTVIADTYREVLVCTNLDGEAVPLHSTPASASSQYSSTGTNKGMSRELFNPNGLIAYNATAGIIAAGGNIQYERLYHQTYFNPRYSLNCGETLVAAPLYLVAEPAEDGQARLVGKRPCWSQELPTQYDGLIYILLGHHSGDTYSFLYPHHPVYWHNGDHICVWSGDENHARDLAPVERGTLASRAYAEGDLLVTGSGLRRATEDIDEDDTISAKTERTTIADEIKRNSKNEVEVSETEPTDPNVEVWIDPQGEADRKSAKKKDIIVARAIPETPMTGDRYFFSSFICVRTTPSRCQDLEENSQNWVSRRTGDNSSEVTILSYKTDHPVLVTIKEDFTLDDFVTDESYMLPCCQDASYLTTRNTASPYFEIQGGKLVCVKRPKVKLKNGDLTLLESVKIKKEYNGHFSVKKHKRGNGAVYQSRLRWRPKVRGIGIPQSEIRIRHAKTKRWSKANEVEKSTTFIIRGMARGRLSECALKFHRYKIKKGNEKSDMVLPI